MEESDSTQSTFSTILTGSFLSQSTAATNDLSTGSSIVQYDVDYLDPPIKGKCDRNLYRNIRLKNGINACLVERVEDNADQKSLQDSIDTSIGTSTVDSADADMATCVVSIAAGNFQESSKIQGLAHFCEHMIFMGSKKYPKDNDFDKFLERCSGFNNATTYSESTIFEMEFKAEYTAAVLERFAELLKEPLLRKESMTREREAIDSEFQLAFPKDNNRLTQLYYNMINPNLGINSFQWGSLRTLKDHIDDDTLYKETQKFIRTYYTAQNINIALHAKIPLNDLEAIVVENFKGVKNNGLTFNKKKSSEEKFLDASQFHRLYYVESVLKHRKLMLAWELPPQIRNFKSKPLQYIFYLLRFQGCGSLDNYLRRLHYTFKPINAEIFDSSSYCCIIHIELHLTEQGLHHINEILDAVFSYLNLIKSTSLSRTYFSDIQRAAQYEFDYGANEDQLTCTETIAENMIHYPPKYYLCALDTLEQFDRTKITNLLELFSPRTVNIVLLAPKAIEGIKFNMVEPWFQTKYTHTAIPDFKVSKWDKIKPYEEFALPPANKFLVEKFDILSFASIPKHPEKVHVDKVTEVWYKPEIKFNRPQAIIRILIISDSFTRSLPNACKKEIYIALLKLILQPQTYFAELAGITYSIKSDVKGIVLLLNGFNDKLLDLMDIIVKCMVSFAKDITEQVFLDGVKYLKEVFEEKFTKGEQLLNDMRLAILLKEHYTYIDKFREVDKITYKDMLEYASTIFDHCSIICLGEGNISVHSVVNCCTKIRRHFKCEPLVMSTGRVEPLLMPTGDFCFRMNNFLDKDPNNFIMNYYQFGSENMTIDVSTDLLVIMLEEPLFNQLRTQKQLGYDVSCMGRNTFGALGLSIELNTRASKVSANQGDVHIETFLTEFFDQTRNKLTKAMYNDFRERLIAMKRIRDFQLEDMFDRHWSEVYDRKFIFDRPFREIAEIQVLGKKTFMNWVNKYVLSGSPDRRKISFQIVSSKPKSKAAAEKQKAEGDRDESTFISDVLAFKQNLDLVMK